MQDDELLRRAWQTLAIQAAKGFLNLGLNHNMTADMLDSFVANLPRDCFGRHAFNSVAQVLRTNKEGVSANA